MTVPFHHSSQHHSFIYSSAIENCPSSSMASPLLFPSDIIAMDIATIDLPALMMRKDLIPSSSTLSLSDTTDIATIDSPTPAALQLQQRRRKSSVQDVRSVQFEPKVSIKRTIPRHSMTQQERRSCWLQANEFLLIKQRNYMIIKQIHQERANQMIIEQIDDYDDLNNSTESGSESSLLCYRGLEWGMEYESLQRKSYRLGASEEVFLEQEEQYLGDYYDDEAIAYAYYSISNECQGRAEQIAVQDRKDIEDYMLL